MNQRSLAQTFSLIFGIVFLAAGVLGFVPGITTNLGDISFAGSDSPSELLGIFQVSVLHNIVHLLFGIAGVALARTAESAKSYLLVSGVLYVVLFLFGLVIGQNDANFVPVNNADDWLHLILGIGLLAGWYASRGSEAMSRETVTSP
jgi:hypothetical protein